VSQSKKTSSARRIVVLVVCARARWEIRRGKKRSVACCGKKKGRVFYGKFLRVGARAHASKGRAVGKNAPTKQGKAKKRWPTRKGGWGAAFVAERMGATDAFFVCVFVCLFRLPESKRKRARCGI
jgi:hypothetical protein